MVGRMSTPQPTTVLITGGARGLGKALVSAFRDAGSTVLAPTRQELDLADADAVRRWVAGHQPLQVDVLINNAGINRPQPLESMNPNDWDAILQVNLSSAALLMQAVFPHMAQQGWGRIVNISSLYSLVTRAGRAPYAVSKAGLNALTRTAAVEWAAQGILVNAVAPGFVDTEMTRTINSPEGIQRLESQIPLGRLAQPDEIARLVCWLAGPLNTYLTGQVLAQDGGFTCL